MNSVGALLAGVVALRWFLSATGNSIFSSSKEDTTGFQVPVSSGLMSLGFMESGGEQRYHNQQSPNLSERQRAPNWLARDRNRLSTVHEIGKIGPIHIVCIGQCRPHHFLSDEVLDIPGFKVSSELDYRKLFSAINHVPALAVVHDSLHPIELENTCRQVRHKWPYTRILVIHDGEEFLEDSLYDDRVRPDVSGRDLIARILFLVQTLDLWRLGMPE